jgi:type VI secretion system secreted protein VgrG
MQEHEAAHHVLRGSGNVRGFVPGYTFSMTDHHRDDMNDSYLLIELRHSATVGGSYQTGGGGSDAYSNQFTCIPASIPYRPPRVTPKPLIYGVQPAVVIGKSDDTDDTTASDDGATGDGEEIWVDKYGRIIVRFPWDRVGACSCRVRVAQQWAGAGWGGMVIPRVGQEVLVSFLDGDPDRPIVIGCVYNATQKVPYDLPEYQTRSTFKSHSSTGGGDDNYNELRFEDKQGSEQVFIRGEKDYDTRIKNDSREWIGNNRSLMITKDQMEKVSGDVHLQVAGKHYEKVTGDMHSHVAGNLNQKSDQTISIQAGQNLYEKSGQNYAHQAGQMIHLKAGMTVVIEAGTELSLVVGGNFIDINSSGISIFGTMVNINSGGSAGSGCGSSPTDPTDPKDPDEADDGSKGTKMN